MNDATQPSQTSQPLSQDVKIKLLRAVDLARAGRLQACRQAVDVALGQVRGKVGQALAFKAAGALRYVTRDYDLALKLLTRAGQLEPRENVECVRLAVQRAGRLGWEQELRAGLTWLAEKEPLEVAWVSALARLYADRRVLPEALAHARQVVALAPDADAWLRLAKLAAQADRTEEAIAAVDRALAAGHAVDPLRAAAILCDAGAFAQAATVLQQAEQTSEVLDRRAQLALWHGRESEATVLALQAHAMAGVANSPAGQRTLGALAWLAGQTDRAMAHLDRAIEGNPRDDEALCWRAELHLRHGRIEQASQDLDRAMLAADGFSLAAWLLRECGVGDTVAVGLKQSRFGEVREGLQVLCADAAEVLERRDPAEIHALLWRALGALHGNRSTTPTYLLNGELQRVRVRTAPRHGSRQVLETIRLLPPERVLADLDAVVARFGHSSLCPCHRGELHLWLGDTDAARTDLQLALTMLPTTRWAWIGLGGCDLLDQQPEQALAVLADGVRVLGNTDGPAVFVYRGEALLRLGRCDEAIRDLTEALDKRPTRLAARLLLTLALHGRGDIQAMRGHFEDLRRRAPGLLSESGRVAHVVVWDEPGWLPNDAAIAQVCESALTLLRGNRSSTCTTWLTPEGRLRAVPHETREVADPNARDAEDLAEVERWLRDPRR